MGDHEQADEDPRRIALARLLLQLRQQGIRDKRLFRALERTPRDLFVPAPYKA